MDALYERVDDGHEISVRLGPQNGAIIADPRNHTRRVARTGEVAPDQLDQRIGTGTTSVTLRRAQVAWLIDSR